MGRSIMIVEDERIIARDLAAILGKLGYGVTAVAENGRDAIDLARKQCPDLVLMDIVLSGELDGIETACRIHESLHLPIVYVTAFADPSTVERAKRAEPHGFILKPFQEREIRTTIEIALYKSEMEQKMRRQEQMLSAILVGVEDTVIAIDPHGLVQFINPAGLKLLGWHESETRGRRLQELATLILADALEASPNLLNSPESLRQMSDGPKEFILINRDGVHHSVALMVKTMESKYEFPYGYIVTITDLTERRRLEEEAYQVKKMEAMRRLAGGVAHDFNNLTAVILGYASLISQATDEGDSRHAHAKAILDSAQRCAALTKTLLALAGSDVAHHAVMNPNKVLESMRTRLYAMLDVERTLKLNPGEGVWNIRIDPAHLDQIIMNLVTNALEALEPGGRLVIGTENIVIDARYCSEHPGCRPGEYVRMTFSDTGHGMDETIRERIFEPFFSTKQGHPGTGLGLAVVFGIVRQNNGFIEVTSSPREGSTFSVYLPRSLETVAVTGQGQAAGPVAGGETVLVVEDEELLLDLISQELCALGYDVVPAKSPNEALAFFSEREEEIKVVVTDMMMPQMDGKALAEKVRAMKAGIPIVIMSGYTEDVIAVGGKVESGITFLQKPFRIPELARKIRTALDGL